MHPKMTVGTLRKLVESGWPDDMPVLVLTSVGEKELVDGYSVGQDENGEFIQFEEAE